MTQLPENQNIYTTLKTVQNACDQILRIIQTKPNINKSTQLRATQRDLRRAAARLNTLIDWKTINP